MKKYFKIFLFIFMASNQITPSNKTNFDTVLLSEEVVPKVVDVYAYNDGNNVFLPFELNELERMFFGMPRAFASSGTGCVISEDGIIVTCAHVIKGASKVFVGLNDGRKIEAEVIKSNNEMRKADIAFLKIKSKKLPFLKLASSKTKVKLGEPVLVAGNAFGMGKTSVFSGIISFINRVVDGKVVLQSDVNINVGNSGGPMVNSAGEMIGMAFAIPSKAGGLAFFVPSSIIQYYYDKYLLNKPSPYWGVQAQEMNSEMLESMGLNDKNIFGVIVTNLSQNSPAKKILERGDVIVEINGQKLASKEELEYFEKISTINEETEVKIFRNGDFLSAKLIPIEAPKENLNKTEFESKLLKGVKLVQKKEKVVVKEADNNFLQEGDTIIALNGKKVSGLKDIEENESLDNEMQSITIQRGGAVITQSFGNNEGNNSFFSQSIIVR